VSVREPLLEEIIKLLDAIIPLLARVRVIMRKELGITNESPG
jgi:hypothetical protein